MLQSEHGCVDRRRLSIGCVASPSMASAFSAGVHLPALAVERSERVIVASRPGRHGWSFRARWRRRARTVAGPLYLRIVVKATPAQPNRVAGRDPQEAERVVLSLLLDPNVHGPWSVRELGRELGDQVEAEDAVATLHAAGLVHRCHDLVFPSRAAARCFDLAERA